MLIAQFLLTFDATHDCACAAEIPWPSENYFDVCRSKQVNCFRLISVGSVEGIRDTTYRLSSNGLEPGNSTFIGLQIERQTQLL